MILLVLGMHRSGTSALTRTLSLMGATIPGTLMAPVPGENPLGFWESREVMESHERFLAAVGSSWDDMRPVPAADFHGAPARSCRDELSVVIERAREGQPLLVIKDPRICRLLPLWLRLLEEVGEEARAVLSVRNPMEVAHSLLARNGIERERGLMLWLGHMLAAEKESRIMRREIVPYADCLAAPREVAEELARSLGCFDPEQVREALPGIEAFWRQDLRHHARDDTALLADPVIPAWIRDAYRALSQRPLPIEDLDRLNREVARALEGVGRYLAPVPPPLPPPPDRAAEVMELTGQAAELKKGMARLISDLDALEQRRVETAHALSREETLRTRSEAEAGALQQRLSEALAAIAEQNGALRVKDEQAGRLAGDLADNRTLLAERERQLAEKEAIQSRQTAVIEAQNQELRREGERLGAALASVKSQTDRLIEKEAALARQAGLVQAKDREIARIAKEAKRLGDLALRRERELAERKAEVARLTAELTSAAGVLNGVTTELAQRDADLRSMRGDLLSRDLAMEVLREEVSALQRRLEQERDSVSASIRVLEASLDRQRTHLAVLSFAKEKRRG